MLAPAVAIELAGQDFEGAVVLFGPQHTHTDRPGNEVCKLQPRRVGLLVGENDLERQRRAELVLTVANPAELQFKVLVLLFAAAFEDHVGLLGVLVLLDEELVECLKAEAEGEMVGVAALDVAGAEAVLVDYTADEDEVGIVDDPAEAVDKAELFSFIGELERPGFFADFALVQDHDVVAEVVELELLERRDDLLAVMLFVEDAESQDEQRVVRIDGLHPVISALIDIDDEVAEAPRRCGGALAVFDHRVEIEIE